MWLERAVAPGERFTPVGSCHVSQQHTFTGTLTEAFFDAALRRAAELTG